MALSCQLSLNYSSYAAGQTPPPMATLQVYNPNAVAVVVTAIEMYSNPHLDTGVNDTAMSPCVPPIGPGMTTSVPALSSINIGPFPIVVGSSANANSFAAVNQTGNLNPVNAQPSQPMQYILSLKARVYGSDGSVNEAGRVALLVSYGSAPPVGFQGGFLNFASPNNFIGLTPGWP